MYRTLGSPYLRWVVEAIFAGKILPNAKEFVQSVFPPKDLNVSEVPFVKTHAEAEAEATTVWRSITHDFFTLKLQ